MQLAQILVWRYPNASTPDDYAVQDDGSGAYIAYWDEVKLGPRPTAEQVASWEIPAAKFYKRREMRRAADSEYEGIFAMDGEFLDMERDNIVLKTAMGIALTLAEQNKRSQMRATREKLQTKLQEVNALNTTAADIEAIVW